MFEHYDRERDRLATALLNHTSTTFPDVSRPYPTRSWSIHPLGTSADFRITRNTNTLCSAALASLVSLLFHYTFRCFVSLQATINVPGNFKIHRCIISPQHLITVGLCVQQHSDRGKTSALHERRERFLVILRRVQHHSSRT